jgi:hypothetical protein
MITPARRKHSQTARCPRHGLVLVDDAKCALCKSGRNRSTSPWIIASVGGVAVAALIAVRALDRVEPSATSPTTTLAPAPASRVPTRVERARPVYERLPARTHSVESAREVPVAAQRPAFAPGSEPADDSVPAEDRLLGQPATTAERESHVDRPPPPDPPSVRGFPPPAREDDPADFE